MDGIQTGFLVIKYLSYTLREMNVIVSADCS